MHPNPLGGLSAPTATNAPKLIVPLGPASVEVPLSGWQRVLAKLRGQPLEDQIRFLPQHAHLRLMRPDEGTAEFSFAIVNFSRRELTLERVICDQWLWQNQVMPELPVSCRRLGSRIARRSMMSVSLAMQLSSGAGRRLLESIRPACNPLSTPDARMTVICNVFAREVSEPMRMHLEFPIAEVSVHTSQV